MAGHIASIETPESEMSEAMVACKRFGELAEQLSATMDRGAILNALLGAFVSVAWASGAPPGVCAAALRHQADNIPRAFAQLGLIAGRAQGTA